MLLWLLCPKFKKVNVMEGLKFHIMSQQRVDLAFFSALHFFFKKTKDKSERKYHLLKTGGHNFQTFHAFLHVLLLLKKWMP